MAKLTMEQLAAQNEALLKRLDELELAQKNIAPPEKVLDPTKAKAAKGHKFVKARVLDQDGDLVWGIIEVPDKDKRKAFDPKTGRLHNRSDVMKGNPMAEKPVGENDVEVTGL